LGTLKEKDSKRGRIEAQHKILEEVKKEPNKESQYLTLSELASRPIQLQKGSRQEKEARGGSQVGQEISPNAIILEKDLQSFKRTGLRWAILKCLDCKLKDNAFDIPPYVDSDLGMVRSIIETGCSHLDAANRRLDSVQNTLLEKALVLHHLEFKYWEDLLWIYYYNKLSKADLEKMPYFKALASQYPVLAYCIS
jgi:hypothetical protein